MHLQQPQPLKRLHAGSDQIHCNAVHATVKRVCERCIHCGRWRPVSNKLDSLNVVDSIIISHMKMLLINNRTIPARPLAQYNSLDYYCCCYSCINLLRLNQSVSFYFSLAAMDAVISIRIYRQVPVVFYINYLIT